MVTYALLALNIVAYIVTAAIAGDARNPVAGPVWQAVLIPEVSPWWTWVSYAFLHGGPLHLVGNMLFLWVFAQAVEDRFGKLGFSAFYLIGAVATGGAHALFSDMPVVGASGAIACCTGAYLVMFPLANVRVFVLFFGIGVSLWPAWLFIVFAVFWDVVTWAMGGMGIAVEAHLAGYAYGFGVAFVLLAMRIVPREPYDLFTAVNQKRRRSQIRHAVRSAGWEAPMAAKQPRTPKREKPPTAEEAAADLRKGIQNALAERRPGSAATMYRRLLDNHEDEETRLPRDNQLDLANTLYQREHHDLAARAYEGFLKAHPDDGEAPMVRVLLARVMADHLNDTMRAKELLRQALMDLKDPQLKEVAQADLDALDAGGRSEDS